MNGEVDQAGIAGENDPSVAAKTLHRMDDDPNQDRSKIRTDQSPNAETSPPEENAS